MARTPALGTQLTGRYLSRWRLIEEFKARLAKAAAGSPLHPTWSAPRRLLQYTDYLSLFLLGLINPVVRTLRKLRSASRLQWVQKEVCSRPCEPGGFSKAQAVLDPAQLGEVFTRLSQGLQTDPCLSSVGVMTRVRAARSRQF